VNSEDYPLPGSVKREECPNRDNHANGPVGYMAWHAWADERSETHDQHQCPGCGLWLILTPKQAVALEDK
jgi:hypothetical protein